MKSRTQENDDIPSFTLFVFSILVMYITFCLSLVIVDHKADTLDIKTLNNVCNELYPGSIYVDDGFGASSNFVCKYPEQEIQQNQIRNQVILKGDDLK